jgi:hypothetical protein
MPREELNRHQGTPNKTAGSIVLTEDGEFSHPFLKKLSYLSGYLPAYRKDGDNRVVVLAVSEAQRLLHDMEVLAQFANVLRKRVDEYEKDLPSVSIEELTASMRAEGKLPADKFLPWEKQ